MVKEVVWVFGASAAGKATFINNITENPSSYLIKKLGWDKKQILACRESLEWLGLTKDDVEVRLRQQIPILVTKLINQADVVLIKGQDIDLIHERPLLLRNLIRQANHKIIYIRTPLETLMKRLPDKLWWNGIDTEADTEKWVKYQIRMLETLMDSFKVLVLSGREGDNYKQIDASHIFTCSNG